MPVKPADKATRSALLDILSRFLKDYDSQSGTFAVLLCKIYGQYQLGALDASGLESMLSKCSDVQMRTQNQFLHLEPTRKGILPLVTFQSSHNWIHFRIYALLTKLDGECNLQSFGIRLKPTKEKLALVVAVVHMTSVTLNCVMISITMSEG